MESIERRHARKQVDFENHQRKIYRRGPIPGIISEGQAA
jgi:hypothetical protein